jgi:DNA mismatch repair protein MutH
MNITTEKHLLERAKELKGKLITDLVNGKLQDQGKGAIGNIIEREGFGVANNNDAKPDFPHLGIELKALPLKKNSNGKLSVKERTKICSINYQELVEEKWTDSHARVKLKKILFIFYVHDATDLLRSKIVDHFLFELENNDEPLIQSDWQRTQERVREGYAHELSESENVILAASRSGAGKLEEHKWPKQPNTTYSERARQRAFSLKPSYTRTIWHELRNHKQLERISDKYEFSDPRGLEAILTEKLNFWTGRSLSEYMKSNGLQISTSKNAAATILRTALGYKKGSEPLREINQLGLIVKTTPCRKSDLYPFESMSFPYQPLAEIAAEDRFDESEFYTYLQGFIFIPLIRENKKDRNPSKVTFGRSFIWRPSKKDLLAIQKEWEKIHQIIKNGIIVERVPTKNRKGFITTNNLLKESESEYIHMRPHGKNSDDIDKSMGDLNISKQCFWFNKKLIHRLVIESGGNRKNVPGLI